jgi:formylglycine-generating enzyme required for sulfatase activity
MVVVPPGEFSMGSDAINEMRGGIARPEGPVRKITIAYKFGVGRFEVTNAEFESFVTATGYQPAKKCGMGMNEPVEKDVTFRGPILGQTPVPNAPAVCISWTDAKAYVAWLSATTGKRYRLLTEAEWEYAARGGSTAKWPWGDQDTDACKYENTFDLDSQAAVPAGSRITWSAVDCHDGHGLIAPVGSYKPNHFGLHDMLGNVWEWAEDCSFELYPPQPTDGSAVQAQGACPLRAVRGGSWYTRQDRHRPSFRGRDPEDKSIHHFGFRVARDIQ